jgi:hypothetical protein
VLKMRDNKVIQTNEDAVILTKTYIKTKSFKEKMTYSALIKFIKSVYTFVSSGVSSTLTTRRLTSIGERQDTRVLKKSG